MIFFIVLLTNYSLRMALPVVARTPAAGTVAEWPANARTNHAGFVKTGGHPDARPCMRPRPFIQRARYVAGEPKY